MNDNLFTKKTIAYIMIAVSIIISVLVAVAGNSAIFVMWFPMLAVYLKKIREHSA